MILLKLNSQSKNTKKSPKKKSDVNTVILTKLIVDNITLPKKMSQMDYFSLSQAAKQVFESFKVSSLLKSNPSGLLIRVEASTVCPLISVASAK